MRWILRLFLAVSILIGGWGAYAALARPATPQATQPIAKVVYITRTGKKYHAAGCRHLAKSKIAIKLSDAKARGYTACSVCGGGE